MEIDNQTNDPIDYEQTGSTGGEEDGAERCTKTNESPIEPGGSTGVFTPCGEPQYDLRISNHNNGKPLLELYDIQADARVVLG